MENVLKDSYFDSFSSLNLHDKANKQQNLWARRFFFIILSFERNGVPVWGCRLSKRADTSETRQISEGFPVDSDSSSSGSCNANQTAPERRAAPLGRLINTFVSRRCIQEETLKSNTTARWHTEEQHALFTDIRLLGVYSEGRRWTGSGFIH